MAPKELPQEHPASTTAELRNHWLHQDSVQPHPQTLRDFLETTQDIGLEWYWRWEGLWKKVNPKLFKHQEDQDEWLREQQTKALAVWHAVRAMRMFWQQAGLWRGNPFDPKDKGEFLVPGFSQSPPSKDPSRQSRAGIRKPRR